VGDLLKRPYQSDDASALADLFNLLDAHAGGHDGSTASDVQSMISTLIADPAQDTSLWFAPEGELVAAGVTLSPPSGGYRVELAGGVHPRWRGRGFGRELFAYQLGRAEAIHAASEAKTEWLAQASAISADEDTLRLFRRFGMAPLRYWFEMVADTAAPADVPAPEGLMVAAYRTEDEKPLYEAHTEAFRDHWGYQPRGPEVWLALSVRAESFRPELSRLAFDGDELVGYVMSYQDADPSRLYVGQVGTRRPWRRRGVAAGLLGEVIAAAKQAGYASVSLGVDADSPTGAVGVYERVGFSVEFRAVSYSKPLPAVS
jgi:ribosomal protein S18 acetylase RimI-like enzyme